MARGIRNSTKDIVAMQLQTDPHAFGPFMASLAFALNIPSSLVAEIAGIHEQTVLRWFTGRGTATPPMMIKLARAAAFLAWLKESDWPVLVGTVEDRKAKLAKALKMFKELAKP